MDPTSRKKRRKIRSGSGEPTAPRSAYNFFFKEKQERLKLEDSNRSLTLTGIGQNWKKLDNSSRERYIELAARDKRRYALDIIRWKQTGGFVYSEGLDEGMGSGGNSRKKKRVLAKNYGQPSKGSKISLPLDKLYPIRIFPQGVESASNLSLLMEKMLPDHAPTLPHNVQHLRMRYLDLPPVHIHLNSKSPPSVPEINEFSNARNKPNVHLVTSANKMTVLLPGSIP